MITASISASILTLTLLAIGNLTSYYSRPWRWVVWIVVILCVGVLSHLFSEI